MIEKLSRVFEKLSPEHRDIMREAFTILIEEVINMAGNWRKDMKEGFEMQEKENQRIWQAIEENRKANQKHFKRLDRKLTALGARWGLMAEGTFRAGLKKIIEDLG